ncbi:MAG: exosortase family protein XrtF [Bacteroidetes bacterium]|nr:exosortase family protein XrtF [Bacteroidota bacterium]
MKFFLENKKALIFLLTFVGVYLVLNTIYALYIGRYYPASDPITQWVSDIVVGFLSLFDASINSFPSLFSEYIPIANDRENMIYVFEGCNGLNVMIVYFSFLVAFRGPVRLFVGYAISGIILVFILNIARIALLYGVAFYFPEQLYFFHKYFFTATIYAVVFLLWYFWVKQVRKLQGE